MLHTSDVKPLLLFTRHDEVRRPAAHAHPQMPVFLRLNQRSFEFFRIRNRHREHVATHTDEGIDQPRKPLGAGDTLKAGRGEPQIDGCACRQITSRQLR